VGASVALGPPPAAALGDQGGSDPVVEFNSVLSGIGNPWETLRNCGMRSKGSSRQRWRSRGDLSRRPHIRICEKKRRSREHSSSFSSLFTPVARLDL